MPASKRLPRPTREAETLARTRGSPRISARMTGSRREPPVDRRPDDLRRQAASDAGGASGNSRRSGRAGGRGGRPVVACGPAITLIVVSGGKLSTDVAR